MIQSVNQAPPCEAVTNEYVRNIFSGKSFLLYEDHMSEISEVDCCAVGSSHKSQYQESETPERIHVMQG